MFKPFYNQARKPEGILGKLMLYLMNKGHSKLREWSFSFLNLTNRSMHALDIGCGGGASIIQMLECFPNSKVDGIDYSEECVDFSRKRVQKFGSRSNICQGDVKDLPYEDCTFDLVTAFETIYFWQDLKKAFLEVRRVLKPEGLFMVCCVLADSRETKWSNLVDDFVIHEGGEMKELLEQLGFHHVEIHKNQKGWMCLIAQ